MVESYCRPGSAHAHAASVILVQSSLALTFLKTFPSVLLISSQSLLFSTFFRKSFVTLIELLEFCPDTVK